MAFDLPEATVAGGMHLERSRDRAMDDYAGIRKSGDQFRAILEKIADGITVQDRSGRLTFANDAAAHMNGFASAEEMVRAGPSELLERFEIKDERGLPLSPELLPGRRALAGEETPDVVLRFRIVATGEERWAVVKARPVFDEDGTPVMAINVFRDITDRKRAEQAQRFLADATGLLASSLDYETTLARVASLAVPTAADWCVVHLLDEDGTLQPLAIAHVNPAKVEMAKEMPARHALDATQGGGIASVLRTGRPELFPDASSLLAAAGDDPERQQVIQELGAKSAMVVPMIARGRTLGVITLLSTQPGRGYGSDDLALAQHLARRAALAVDNARLYREAQEAVQVRNRLFSSVSHDLKNPLTGIKGMAQLLKRRVARLEIPERERLMEGLSSIDAAATRMTSQIDELLDLARLQLGQSPKIHRRPTDLVKLVQEAASEQQRLTERHRIVVKSDLPRLVGEWDNVRLNRLVMNLISNALKYSPGGGEIEIAVRQEARDGRDWAVLSVRDEGIGIPAADLEKVFEEFHRGENVEGRISGTGLGLTSARQIAEIHGGSIEVSSEEGGGSTFTVRLPVRGEKGSEEAA